MKKISLGYQVFYAVLFGILAGLFFGPLCSVLAPIAMTFTMLVQMVVLPYICFSLIHGLGSISPGMGKKLLKWGLPFLLLIWGSVIFVLWVVDHLVPSADSSILIQPMSAHSVTLTQQLLKFIVPENPIYDLANNIVPAIAVFGLIVGVALMHVEKKQTLCDILERINQVIDKILEWLAIISPIGAFAHIAMAFGTVRFEDLYKLEFYVLCFVGISLFVTFVILPLILSSLTHLTFKDCLKAFRAVCLLPFVTALTSIAVPFLNNYIKMLAKKSEVKFHENSQTVLPIAYSFGQIGNSVVLFFLFFISFYYRHPLEGTQKTLLFLLSIPMSVGSSSNSVNSISFLIEQFNFPPEALELFMETASITANFQALMSVASILTIIILTLFGYYGLLKFQWKKLFLRLSATLGVFFIGILVIKSMINLNDKYQNLYYNLSVSEVIDDPVAYKMLNAGDRGTIRDPQVSSLEQILKTGVLKVGYSTINTPYCYRNAKGELAGFDMAYAFQFARDLDCTIEFSPIDFTKIGDELNQGLYDIGMSSVVMTEERLKQISFTNHYAVEDNVLIIPVDRKKDFIHLDSVEATTDYKIGVIGAYYDFVKKHFPNATLYTSTDIDTEAMKRGEVAAWMWAKDPAVVWCLSNPGFIVIDYQGLIGKTYFAYGIRDNAFKFASYLNDSMILKELSGFHKQMHDYWIKGEPVKPRHPRWSILHNVLHYND